MRILPVLDVRGGQAVRAVAGDRRNYQLLQSRFAPGSSDPLTIARGLRDAGATELYLADLDAITGRAAPDHQLYQAVARLDLRLWVDAGAIRARADVTELIAARVAIVVVGLESGSGPDELKRIVDQAGVGQVAWSLDLRDGVPIIAPGATWAGDRRDPANLVAQAVGAGVRQIIRLDLARVGTGQGVDHLPAADPSAGVAWWAGGGVRGADDLKRLADRGYAGVLIGSALHDGRLGLNGRPGQGGSPVSGHRTS